MDNVTKIEIENRSTRISITEIIVKILKIMTDSEDLSYIMTHRDKGGCLMFRNVAIKFPPVSQANPPDKLYFYIYDTPTMKDEK